MLTSEMLPGTSQPTLDDLQRLVEVARRRGDGTMAALLTGIQLYARLGREYELLEAMRTFAHEIQPAVEGTPSAEQLRELYERRDPE